MGLLVPNLIQWKTIILYHLIPPDIINFLANMWDEKWQDHKPTYYFVFLYGPCAIVSGKRLWMEQRPSWVKPSCKEVVRMNSLSHKWDMSTHERKVKLEICILGSALANKRIKNQPQPIRLCMQKYYPDEESFQLIESFRRMPSSSFRLINSWQVLSREAPLESSCRCQCHASSKRVSYTNTPLPDIAHVDRWCMAMARVLSPAGVMNETQMASDDNRCLLLFEEGMWYDSCSDINGALSVGEPSGTPSAWQNNRHSAWVHTPGQKPPKAERLLHHCGPGLKLVHDNWLTGSTHTPMATHAKRYDTFAFCEDPAPLGTRR